MNVSKIAGAFLLIMLGTSVLLSCNNSKPAPPQVSSPTTVQANEPTDDKSLTPSPTTLALQDSNTTLVLVADEISSLDPYRMISVHPDESVASHIWDTLTLLNDDLEIEPNLAESWRLVNNFTWEIKLRQGITFHNDEPFNAQAVRFSIERAESMPGSLERFAQDISLEGVDIIDDYTVRLTTRQTIVNLPFHLAFLEILPPVYYSETPPDQLEVAPVGSGPYRLHQWVPGEAVILEPVPNYWKGAPSLPCLVFQTVPSLDGRLAALRDGQASLVTNLPPMSRDQTDSAAGKLVAIESTQRMLVGMRIRAESPLSDKRVRQALNYGVNVEQIADLWLQGYGKRYGSWVNPPGNNLDLAPWPYDPAQARELLTQAGYQQKFTITLSSPVGVYHQDSAIAQAIAQQLGEIGVGVQVQTVDWSTFARQLLSEDAPPLFLLGINSRGNELEDVRNLSAAFAFNPVGWQNDTFEDLLWKASNTINENARSRLLNEAQALAYDEAPWIWLWRSYAFYWLNQSLDWTPRRDGLVNLYQPGETSGDVSGAMCANWQAILRPTATPEPTPTTIPDTPTPPPGVEPIQVIPTLIPTKTPTPLATPTPTPTPTPVATATFTPYPTAQPASPVPTTPVQQTAPPATQPPATQPPPTQPPPTQPPPTQPPPTQPPPTQPPPTQPPPTQPPPTQPPPTQPPATGRPTAGPSN